MWFVKSIQAFLRYRVHENGTDGQTDRHQGLVGQVSTSVKFRRTWAISKQLRVNYLDNQEAAGQSHVIRLSVFTERLCRQLSGLSASGLFPLLAGS